MTTDLTKSHLADIEHMLKRVPASMRTSSVQKAMEFKAAAAKARQQLGKKTHKLETLGAARSTLAAFYTNDEQRGAR